MKIKQFKKIASVTGAALVLLLTLTSCTTQTVNNVDKGDFADAAKLLTEVKTTQFFAEDEIPQEDIDKILSAGINAPSAMNTQPWHFTAVADEETNKVLADAMKKMEPPAPPKGDKPDMPPPSTEAGTPPADAPNPPAGGFSKAPNKAGIGDAPLTIVVSCKEGSELDAGLAVQNMSAEAQLTGYGTKIMTAPTMALNTEEYLSMLDVPEGYKIAAVLIVGKAADKEDNPDAVSTATTRNAFDEVVSFVK